MTRDRAPENSPSRSARSAAVVMNTRSRTGEEVFFKALDRLDELGVPIGATYAVRDPTRLADTVQEVLARGDCKLLVLGGGDGTVSSVVDFLAHRDVILGLLPLGTANDFARTLEIPPDLDAACETIANGKVVDVDLGLAGKDYFVNVASVGLATGVTQALSPRLKKSVGALAYPVAAVKAFLKHKPFSARLIFPDGDHETVEHERLLHVAVGNGRFYGGGMVVAPDATMRDKSLDIQIIELGRHRDLFGVARYLKSGDFINQESVSHYETCRLRLETEPVQQINIDGEVGSWTPEDFSVVPSALKVMVPREPSGTADKAGEGGRP